MTETLYKRMFKLNSDGKSIQVWEMHCSGDDKSYWTISGRQGGAMVQHKPTAVTPKVNRTQREQVLLEMDSKIDKQRRKKYVENVADVGKNADSALPGYSAMLAKKWEDQKKKIMYPCTVQPKLDGIRCLATKDGFFSRGRKEIEACAHIREALVPFFEKYPDAQLDGELYSHEFRDDFETIIKAVRKTNEKATESDLALQRKVQYHVYDAPKLGDMAENVSFNERYAAVVSALQDISRDCVRLVATINDVASEKEVKDAHGVFMQDGYEGTMVRNTNMPYEGKRSNNLLKLKEFDDDEFEIIGINEGKGGLVGHAAAFVMEMSSGEEFKGKLEGSFARLKWIWKNPDEVIGKMATVRYQGFGSNGRPRFPVVKSIRGMKDKRDWL